MIQFIYSSLKHERGGDKNTIFVVIELRVLNIDTTVISHVVKVFLQSNTLLLYLGMHT